MTLYKMIIPPDQNSYSFNDGIEVLSASLDGGASRFRKDILNANLKLNVQWTLDRTGYNFIRVFYKTMLQSGSLPFLMDLYVDDPFTLSEHECHFMPGTIGLKSQAGESFIVGATIEVKPIDQSQTNIDVASLYALFGDQYNFYNDAFDTLINVTIPADLP